MGTKPHVLVLILPVQGHINPLLQFSKIIASRGIKVTVVFESSIETTFQADNQSELIKFECMTEIIDQENVPENSAPDAWIEIAKVKVLEQLPLILENKASSGEPVNVLVYDSLPHYACDIAKQFGIQAAAFFTHSATVSAIYHHLHEGTLKFPSKEEPITISLPSLPYVFKPKDLPSYVYDS
ncbi:OLC1v1008049C1 [Oldenlandia corymbosa var. corymbosa]|uniref:OLC1v1008049C1 n=1 Tax=Oldenlandia corymbosa var. corymbosa TaxID=529605 RepID=A0AAV1DN78_OLDCO|nr:OLC1v1008049C1 [Oldenlandia corymbosa var. corymbosa]